MSFLTTLFRRGRSRPSEDIGTMWEWPAPADIPEPPDGSRAMLRRCSRTQRLYYASTGDEPLYLCLDARWRPAARARSLSLKS